MNKEFLSTGTRAIIKILSILAISLLLASILIEFTNVYLSVGFRATDFFRLMEVYLSSCLSSYAGLIQLIGCVGFFALFLFADKLVDKIEGKGKIVTYATPIAFLIGSAGIVFFDLFYWIVNLVQVFPKIGKLFESFGQVTFLDGYYYFVEIFAMLTSCLILLLGVVCAVLLLVKILVKPSNPQSTK
ncbi:MAG: hypothetical protein IJ400_03185 [Clostridia bacterium]|nr:hypothetical protein [Clostridia bacterium]